MKLQADTTNQLKTAVIIINKNSHNFESLNLAAEKILGWDISTLNSKIKDLNQLSTGLANFAKCISELNSGDLDQELLEYQKSNRCKRIELLINNQYFNAYIQIIDNSFYLIELSQIIYQDMNQSTHELKRPIQNIKALVETLKIGAKDDPIKCNEYLEKLEFEADRLGTLVSDMLNLSHIINGSIELNKVEFDLHSRIDKLIKSAASRAKTRNIELINNTGNNKINADLKLFDHILGNLIDNAIKYNNDNGKVFVESNQSTIIIKDTGMGIAKEDLTKVFEQFYRTKSSQDIQGSGLGLAIVKAIIDLHSWEIDVESQVGEGTSFIIKML